MYRGVFILIVAISVPRVALADTVTIYNDAGDVEGIRNVEYNGVLYNIHFEWGDVFEVFDLTPPLVEVPPVEYGFSFPRFPVFSAVTHIDPSIFSGSFITIDGVEVAGGVVVYPRYYGRYADGGEELFFDAYWISGDSWTGNNYYGDSHTPTLWLVPTPVPVPLALPQGILLMVGVVGATWWRKRR